MCGHPYCFRTEQATWDCCVVRQSKPYHRSTRANTPDSASFRRFLPFSPCWASAQRRLKNQKSLENTSLPGAGSFVGAEMCPDKERPAENTAVLSRDLTQYGRISARQNRVCPCQSMVWNSIAHFPQNSTPVCAIVRSAARTFIYRV